MNYIKSNINNKQDIQDWILKNKTELDPFIEKTIIENKNNSLSQDLNNIVLEKTYLKFVLPTHIGFIRDALWTYIDKIKKGMGVR